MWQKQVAEDLPFMPYLVGFFRFWYQFIVGDDYRVALGVAATLIATYWLTRSGVEAWWLAPAGVIVVLYTSLRRAARQADASAVGDARRGGHSA